MHIHLSLSLKSSFPAAAGTKFLHIYPTTRCHIPPDRNLQQVASYSNSCFLWISISFETLISTTVWSRRLRFTHIGFGHYRSNHPTPFPGTNPRRTGHQHFLLFSLVFKSVGCDVNGGQIAGFFPSLVPTNVTPRARYEYVTLRAQWLGTQCTHKVVKRHPFDLISVNILLHGMSFRAAIIKRKTN
jgi:hypothetical protein